MKTVAEAIEPLGSEARAWVLGWASEHIGVESPQKPKTNAGSGDDAPPQDDPTPESGSFDSLGELFAAASPGSDAEKALVAGYWLQRVDGAPDFATENVNMELKHLGYGIGNITRAFDNLKATKPQQVIQLRKPGTTKQARKKFKLTQVGIQTVEAMIKNNKVF